MVLWGVFQGWGRISIEVHHWPHLFPELAPILSPTALTSLLVSCPVTLPLEFKPENQSIMCSRLVGLLGHLLDHHKSLTSRFAECRFQNCSRRF